MNMAIVTCNKFDLRGYFSKVVYAPAYPGSMDQERTFQTAQQIVSQNRRVMNSRKFWYFLCRKSHHDPASLFPLICRGRFSVLGAVYMEIAITKFPRFGTVSAYVTS